MPRVSRRLFRASALIPALVAISLLGATRSCDMQVYGLTADSAFSQGCNPPALCPVVIGTSLGGTLRLRDVSRSALSPFEMYRVESVYWLARFEGEDVPITGSGTYRISRDLPLQHRLQLELRVGDGIQRFDSGLVEADGAPFPAIDIRISTQMETYFDMFIDVRSIPLPFARDNRTPCGSELMCDSDSEICVGHDSTWFPLVYSCEPVPDGCEEDHTCGCAESLCDPYFRFCTEPAINTLSCRCLSC